MLRIVGVQVNQCPQREFVLLQNQGNLKVQLRGSLLMGESILNAIGSSPSCFLFREDEVVPSACFVMVISGKGQTHWHRGKDGSLVLKIYMNREESHWGNAGTSLHFVVPQHSYNMRSAVSVA